MWWGRRRGQLIAKRVYVYCCVHASFVMPFTSFISDVFLKFMLVYSWRTLHFFPMDWSFFMTCRLTFDFNKKENIFYKQAFTNKSCLSVPIKFMRFFDICKIALCIIICFAFSQNFIKKKAQLKRVQNKAFYRYRKLARLQVHWSVALTRGWKKIRYFYFRSIGIYAYFRYYQYRTCKLQFSKASTSSSKV